MKVDFATTTKISPYFSKEELQAFELTKTTLQKMMNECDKEGLETISLDDGCELHISDMVEVCDALTDIIDLHATEREAW